MRVRNMRYQVRLFLYYSVAVSVILAAEAFGFYLYSVDSIRRSEEENLRNLSIKVAEQADSVLERMDSLALQIMYNPEIVQVFKGLPPTPQEGNYFAENIYAARKLTDTLASINGPNFSAQRFSLYNRNGSYVSQGILPDALSAVKSDVRENRMREFQTRLPAEKRLILPPHPDFWSGDTDRLLISVLRPLTDLTTENVYGVVEVQQPYSVVEKLFNFGDNPDSNLHCYLFSPDQSLIYPPASGAGEEAQYAPYYQAASGARSGSTMIKSGARGDKEILVWQTSAYSGWTVSLVKSYDELVSSSKTLRNIILLFGFVILLMTLAVIYLLSLQLTRPLKQLRSSVHAVTLSHLAIELEPSETSNELLQLNRDFEKMFARLKYAIRQEINAHMLALQAQINPHFLHNVLSTISAAGQEAGSLKVMEMCRKLSDMLRYVSAFSDAGTTVLAEIEHAQNYMDLMKQRYESMLEYTITLADPAVANQKIPVLVLQPLVENSFQHGFYSVEPPWRIGIWAGVRNGRWLIEVEDNGCGFPEHLLAELKEQIGEYVRHPSEYIQKMKFGGLGIINTYIRLNLFYGGDCVFEIENLSPRGTRIRIGGKMP